MVRCIDHTALFFTCEFSCPNSQQLPWFYLKYVLAVLAGSNSAWFTATSSLYQPVETPLLFPICFWSFFLASVPLSLVQVDLEPSLAKSTQFIKVMGRGLLAQKDASFMKMGLRPHSSQLWVKKRGQVCVSTAQRSESRFSSLFWQHLPVVAWVWKREVAGNEGQDKEDGRSSFLLLKIGMLRPSNRAWVKAVPYVLERFFSSRVYGKLKLKMPTSKPRI